MAGRSGMPAPRLSSPKLYFHRDQVSDSWVSQIQKVWTSWKKSKPLREIIHSFFNNMENPYYSALYLLAFSGDLNLGKPNTLAFTVMEEFKAWLEMSGAISSSPGLNLDLKKKAFAYVTRQKNISLIKLVCELYKMPEDSDSFIDEIQDMLDKKMYKEACQIVVILGLQDRYNVEDFLIPLVFQDIMSIVEDYLDATPNSRSELIEYVDNLMKSSETIVRDEIISRLEIPDVKYQKLHYKPMSKFMVRIMKKYNIPSSCCPNLTQKKNKGALQFIITKKYRDNNIGGDSWREMVLETVGSNTELKIELLFSLCAVNDSKEAMYWAEYYNIPFDELPLYLKTMIEDANKRLTDGCDNERHPEETEEWNAAADAAGSTYFEFPLSTDSIVMVDTIDKLQRFIEFEFTDDVKTVGLDAEWKPAFSHSTTELSLVQIATFDRVFLIDLLALDKNSSVWHLLGSKLFANQSILKLGFSFDGDIHMLRQTIRTFENFKMSGIGFLDISVLWKTLTKDWLIKLPFEVPLSSTKNALSLSHLVNLCCGCPLDKADQFSNWEKRPLRDSQKKYAAVDAYCLLLVYETFKECCRKQNIPFFEICDEVMSKVTVKKPINKKKHHKNQIEVQTPPKPNADPVPVSWLYALCMSHMEGLGKKLRMLGIDTLIAPAGRHYEEYLQMALSENRVVLTSGSLYNRFVKDLPPTFCYKVQSTVLEDQVAEVLDYYNIMVKESDIFSRCMVCNFNDFARVESQTMKEMVFESSKQSTAKAFHESSVSASNYLDDFDDDYEDDNDFQPGPPVHRQQLYEPKPGQIMKLGTFKTNKGVDIQLAEIPMGVIDRVPLFYICENCGKCYWDGSHLSRLLQSRSHKLISNSYFQSKLRLSNE